MSEAVSREVFIERTKMSAQACDRASTVAFTVGVFTPTAGLTFGIDPFSDGLGALHVLTLVSWIFWGGLLHFIARAMLRGLER